ncbi:uncharacterized protein MONBRDRAFT_31311 [Monosiga brevicollis MX1]|uniref:Uncharacterized protein n=1 Tax=Monosiga brevicollis TaxID=81824 RepID=A9UR69_MONBE|nr:uncharacterized protein MONBRDRAFT_31311 [Monosiga brevicollis MX1]EDQ91869.1 predicted protein [Monosiga brevicollis MX1]|eukprot:XP_001743155.1 hypothetical protein [Monosiga brevicollis MX1]
MASVASRQQDVGLTKPATAKTSTTNTGKAGPKAPVQPRQEMADPRTCNPRLFPGMLALALCARSNQHSAQAIAEGRAREANSRIVNWMTAEWLPSTNKNFELLTGRVGDCTYYFFSRTARVVCEDLYGGFVAIYAPSTTADSNTQPSSRASKDLLCIAALHKDEAIYAWDLASLLTQGSYFLTFGLSIGLPASVIVPYRQRLEQLLAFPELSQGQLPNMATLSEHLSQITFEAGCKLHDILKHMVAAWSGPGPLAADPLLSAAGQETLFARGDAFERQSNQPVAPLEVDRADLSPDLVRAVDTYNLCVAVSNKIDNGQEAPSREVKWADLDDALKELVEHVILCGLSYVSHLKMPHSLDTQQNSSIFTRNCIAQTIVRTSGVMQPPARSPGLDSVLADKRPFEDLVLHADLDNEHTIMPDALREYMQSATIDNMMTQIQNAIDTFTERKSAKLLADA